MAKNADVLFPDAYEDRSFFSDVGLPQKSILDDHASYMKAKMYKAASATLEATGHEYYGAYLFNALEGRVNRIGEYELSGDSPRIRPYYQDEMPDPSEYYDNLTWISGSQITDSQI